MFPPSVGFKTATMPSPASIANCDDDQLLTSLRIYLLIDNSLSYKSDSGSHNCCCYVGVRCKELEPYIKLKFRRLIAYAYTQLKFSTKLAPDKGQQNSIAVGLKLFVGM